MSAEGLASREKPVKSHDRGGRAGCRGCRSAAPVSALLRAEAAPAAVGRGRTDLSSPGSSSAGESEPAALLPPEPCRRAQELPPPPAPLTPRAEVVLEPVTPGP